MRLAVLIFVLILTFEGWAQPVHPSTEQHLAAFLATNGKVTGGEPFLRHLDHLQGKRAKIRSEQEFVRYAFTSTHKKFLKHFSPQATFAALFETGTYNCLTGTILYSLLLSEFNIRHQVIETNYHIFILVTTREGELLLEATDRQQGVVTGFTEISNRIEMYKSTPAIAVNAASDLSYYQFSFDLYNPVTTEELTGLLYYNLAIDAYNKHNLQQAVAYLGEAIARYASPRIEEMARLLLITVHESQLSSGEKSAFKKTLQTIRYKALPVVAGLQP
jgi:hypothetical protein